MTDNITDITPRRISRLLAYDEERDNREFAQAMRRAPHVVRVMEEEAS